MSKFVDSIIGHAIGDAMGVPIEFEPRNKLLEHPITKMVGYGSHDVPAGTWSDDTSMEIATIDSFINKGNFDCKDIMMNFYYWLKENRFTPTGVVFDAGHTCIQSIINFSKGYELDECGQKDLYYNEINKLYWQELMEIDKRINEPRLPTKGSYEDDINYFFELIGQ